MQLECFTVAAIVGVEVKTGLPLLLEKNWGKSRRIQGSRRIKESAEGSGWIRVVGENWYFPGS